jgi:hypothetical protein
LLAIGRCTTQVGFGDIAPSTTDEMIFGALAELFGTVVFGTLVGTVGSIIGNKNKLQERHEGEIAEIKEFMEAKNLSPALQQKVKKYLAVLFKQTRSFNEREVLEKLPPGLSFELIDHLHGERIKSMPLFRTNVIIIIIVVIVIIITSFGTFSFVICC